MPKFKSVPQNHKLKQRPSIESNRFGRNVIGSPLGSKLYHSGNTARPKKLPNVKSTKDANAPVLPGEGLNRAFNYYADHGGCGWWRMIAPELLLNLDQRAVINGLTTMSLDPRFYSNIKSVRIQRQATPIQLEFVKFLKQNSQHHGFKLIYEIDDIILKDDIPLYNRCRAAFEDNKIYESSLEMMKMCDEMSVTCEYMKNYYMDKTGNKNITVVPNYPAKMWFGGHYHPDQLMKQYDINKKRPRVLYAGSGTHFDVNNKVGHKDDFHLIVDTLIKTRHKYKWVFVGGFPLKCKQYIDNGDMEFHRWFPLKNLWQAYVLTGVQACYAPLLNNTFNKAKSNIKLLEPACCGVPGVYQDIVTYKDALLKFNTGDDLISNLDHLLKDESTYFKYSKKSMDYANTMWLDDHLDEFLELYFTDIGEPREALIPLNPEQKTTISYENKLFQ